MKAKVTVDMIMSWRPCQPDYPRERVEELMDRKKFVTLKQALNLPIPDIDILWLVLRPEFIADKKLHYLAIWIWEDIARPIWVKYYPEDNRPDEAVRIKKLWLKGKATDAELAAARVAAWGTAGEAAMTAGEAAREAGRVEIYKKIIKHIKEDL